MIFWSVSDESASFLLLGGSAVASYAAVNGAIDALLPIDQPAPAKRAIVHSVMTAIVSVAAIYHHPALLDIAAGVPFSASVAAITLALGVILFVAPAREFTSSAVSHRVWAFLLPTGLLALLIGFGGGLTARGALVLSAEGAAVLVVCAGDGAREALGLGADNSAAAKVGQAAGPGSKLVIMQVFFALVLGIVAGWGMVQGAGSLAMQNPAFRPGVAAVLALGPAIVLPMIPPVATLAERGRRDEAISAIVGFALINLCVVLPLVVAVQKVVQTTTATTQPSAAGDLPFPILVWRLDTVLLSTVGLLLLPPAIGRWALSRTEGLALVGIYVIYLFLTLMVSHG